MPLEAPRLILASSSPRREELLREAGYTFEIDPANVDEEAVPAGMSPSDVARYLAESKAKVVAARRPRVVVGPAAEPERAAPAVRPHLHPVR